MYLLVYLLFTVLVDIYVAQFFDMINDDVINVFVLSKFLLDINESYISVSLSIR